MYCKMVALAITFQQQIAKSKEPRILIIKYFQQQQSLLYFISDDQNPQIIPLVENINFNQSV